MPKYRNISMEQRMELIGELLAKGCYLYVKKMKAEEAARQAAAQQAAANQISADSASSNDNSLKPKENIITDVK